MEIKAEDEKSQMADEEALSLRHQLIEARSAIIAQLDELNERSRSSLNSIKHFPPDYAPLIAELSEQLTEIESLLRA